MCSFPLWGLMALPVSLVPPLWVMLRNRELSCLFDTWPLPWNGSTKPSIANQGSLYTLCAPCAEPSASEDHRWLVRKFTFFCAPKKVRKLAKIMRYSAVSIPIQKKMIYLWFRISPPPVGTLHGNKPEYSWTITKLTSTGLLRHRKVAKISTLRGFKRISVCF